MQVTGSVRFARDICPLFTEMDIVHMKPMAVLLDDYEYMSDPVNAANVLERVASGDMPPPGYGEPSWEQEKVQLFRDWMAGGFQP